jgi:hypothetical protein
LGKDVSHVRSIELLNHALLLATSNGMGVEKREFRTRWSAYRCLAAQSQGSP